MSAFLCSAEHLNALVNYAAAHTRSGCFLELMRAPAVALVASGGKTMRAEPPTDAEHTFAVLLAENLTSLEARYPGKGNIPEWCGEPSIYRYDWSLSERPPIEIIKLCHCYAYQTCEHDGWETSDVKKWIDRLEHHAIDHLPGYDAAPWGL